MKGYSRPTDIAMIPIRGTLDAREPKEAGTELIVEVEASALADGLA